MATFDHSGFRQAITDTAGTVYRGLAADVLAEAAVANGLARRTASGALSVTTGVHTGRSPRDKYIVRDALTADSVWWDNTAAMSVEHFDRLLVDGLAALAGRDIYVETLFAGADAAHRFDVNVVTPSPWHALFIRNLLIRPDEVTGIPGGDPVTVLHLPHLIADPKRHGTRSGTVIALDLTRNLVVIAGTAYAGEIKKSVFSLFNFHAPARHVLPMHCSANIGAKGDVALFFGLSGTGKTTLSADPQRPLIGDDEHGWSDRGVFNLEGGCYAKTAGLTAAAEPEIFAATEQANTVLENVVLDAGAVPDFADLSLTENGRAAYPLTALPNVAPGGIGGTPSTVVFLTADAFGVLPPIARLTPDQAFYHFLSGYTAKVAGTEKGVVEPTATFSACFGAPFMSLHPSVYGELLADRLEKSGAATWLINTGWTGGGYGVGKRISLSATRKLLTAALSGALDDVPMRTDPLFGLSVPVAVEGIDSALLEPRRTWADPTAYDRAAEKLVGLFTSNFEKFGDMGEAAEAGPRLQVAAE
ncbi:MAG: pckA [Devosia sp.]|nr:pckA [Devosia sp.]